MQEQMKQQFEQFQNGFKSVFETWPKMMEPALRSSEVAIDSLSELVQEQFQYGRSCLDIGRRQMEAVARGNDVTALFRNQGASSEYYTATLRYSDALRQNAERTQERMVAIAREATDEATSAVNPKAASEGPKAASQTPKASGQNQKAAAASETPKTASQTQKTSSQAQKTSGQNQKTSSE